MQISIARVLSNPDFQHPESFTGKEKKDLIKSHVNFKSSMLNYVYLPPVYRASELYLGPIFKLLSARRNLLEKKAEIFIIAKSCHILSFAVKS